MASLSKMKKAELIELVKSLQTENDRLKEEGEQCKIDWINSEVERLQKECIQLMEENKRLYQKAMRGGRRPVLENDQLEEVKRLRKEGMSLQKLADHFGVAKGTIFNSLKENDQ